MQDNADKRKIVPVETWAEVVPVNPRFKKIDKTKKTPEFVDLKEHAVITTQEQFDKVWEAVGLKGEAPEINFPHAVVFLHVSGGANKIDATYWLDKKGNLTVATEETLVDATGYGFRMDVFARRPIKSYNGKPIK